MKTSSTFGRVRGVPTGRGRRVRVRRPRLCAGHQAGTRRTWRAAHRQAARRAGRFCSSASCWSRGTTWRCRNRMRRFTRRSLRFSKKLRDLARGHGAVRRALQLSAPARLAAQHDAQRHAGAAPPTKGRSHHEEGHAGRRCGWLPDVGRVRGGRLSHGAYHAGHRSALDEHRGTVRCRGGAAQQHSRAGWREPSDPGAVECSTHLHRGNARLRGQRRCSLRGDAAGERGRAVPQRAWHRA